MAIEFDFNADQNRLAIRGELTIAFAGEALARLLGHADMALDLAEVSEMDGSGLQLLLAARRDTGLRLVAASDAVTDVLRLAGLADLMEVPA